ncbi:MAG: hypothetical protein ACPGYY_06135 [Bacteroidia bacterium]
MQKTIWKYLLTSCLLIALSSCENEVQVAADWEEVAVVYGALNPTDDINYIRIQRAFLDQNESALRFVSVEDSIYYDSLEVSIDEYKDGVFVQKFVLNKVDGNDLNLGKDSGLFYDETNELYELREEIKPSAYTVDYMYRLHVRNPRTGYECSATTLSNGKPEVRYPLNDISGTIQPSTDDEHVILVKFKEGKYVRSYSMEMVIRIEEFEKENPSNSEIKTITWNMINSGKTRSLEGFRDADYLVSSSNFFTIIASALKEDPTVSRRLVDYDVNLYGISEDFNTYLEVNKPSIGIVQKKPEFTNLENGLGLFASRHIKRFSNRSYHQSTLQMLKLSEYTSNLGFVD